MTKDTLSKANSLHNQIIDIIHNKEYITNLFLENRYPGLKFSNNDPLILEKVESLLIEDLNKKLQELETELSNL